jgi:D-arabinose 1-dehydrogenase-like Zn-dependent alcohol dehydrogenase
MPESKFETYRSGPSPDKKDNRVWPLYGAGLENLGKDGNPTGKPMPTFGPDELLVRHDACGLCFSDIKVIKLGEAHPRIYRKMKENPVTLGHEVSMTIVGVGENLKNQYHPGDRFILQADIYVNGISYAYGYELQGGLSEYNVLDQRVLNGDHGNYLIPIKTHTGYAEAALVEPWACVIAAYNLQFRTSLKPGGITWFIGPENHDYSISQGFDLKFHPKTIFLTHMEGPFSSWLRKQAKELGIEVIEKNKFPERTSEPRDENLVDDIVLLSPSADLIEKVCPLLSYQGIMALSLEGRLTRPVNIDVGRIHYNRWLFVGGKETDIASLYNKIPVRSSLKKKGKAMFIGAGGPMGRMHVQHAVETPDFPGTIICSDTSDARLKDLDESFGDDARKKGIEWLCVNPTKKEEYEKVMSKFELEGFNDIIILVPIPSVITDASRWLAPGGVLNIFAGVARGITASVDLNELISKNAHIIGQSGSTIEDMITMLNEVESGHLSTNRSVAAVGSLEAAKDGMQSLLDGAFPGKVVIFPNIKPLPLTSIQDLQIILPDVYKKLINGREWSSEAEQAFLEAML